MSALTGGGLNMKCVRWKAEALGALFRENKKEKKKE